MASKSTPSVDPAIVEALIALGVLPTPEVGVEIEAPAKPAKARKTTARKTPAKARKTTAKRTCNITAQEAWTALGADPEFEPRDGSKPASGPMLWRLNANGLLADLLA